MAEGEKTIATNRRARFDYELSDTFEAGLVLSGSEVKALRNGTAQLQESFVKVGKGGLDLMNCTIPEYSHAGYAGHEPRRPRRLLLHGSEIEKLRKGMEQKGMTIVPLRMYFKGGRAKLALALGKGKKTHDKRHTIAERESKRRLDRVLKNR